MLQAASRASRLLGESAGLVANFLLNHLTSEGGFKDRDGKSDLYYTVFGLEGMLALGVEVPVSHLIAYLESFGGGEELDFVHTTCLARCWAALPGVDCPPEFRTRIMRRVASFRSEDGAYSDTPGSAKGTLYGCFLAAGAYQDLEEALPDQPALLACIQGLRAEDGGYANGDDLPMGLTPPTAAAASLLHHLGHPVPPELTGWLLARHHPKGGFFATPIAPIPDLLSTATALHALAGLEVDLGNLKEPCLDFIDSLWSKVGAFHGSWADDGLDCEYIFYALLALGHLC